MDYQPTVELFTRHGNKKAGPHRQARPDSVLKLYKVHPHGWEIAFNMYSPLVLSSRL